MKIHDGMVKTLGEIFVSYLLRSLMFLNSPVLDSSPAVTESKEGF